MSLLKSIHTRWAADATLSALLPSSRVFTGNAEQAADEPTRPYATIATLVSDPPTYTNTTRYGRRSIQFTLYEDAGRHDQCIALAAAVCDAFDRARFSMDDGIALNMQLTGEPQELQDDRGRWYSVVGFGVTTEATL